MGQKKRRTASRPGSYLFSVLMPTLIHHPFCPFSRFVRLVCAEMSLGLELIEEKTWEWRREFLLINPSGETPVMLDDPELTICGAENIAEYLDERWGLGLGERRLLPPDIEGRIEVRRLLGWFNRKFYDEVSRIIADEKIVKRLAGGSPDMPPIRMAKANIRTHLAYIGHLMRTRNWLAGDELSYADFAAAAHLSVVDFCGDVPWDDNEDAKHWYQRIKSRPSFRVLLTDRLPGMTPAPVYAAMDF
jgi:glutathione S-transferase